MSTTTEFQIPVTDLDAGGKPFAFAVRPAWVRTALEDTDAQAGDADGKIDVRASRSGSDVIVHGTLDVPVAVPCARCLNPFPLAIHSDLSLIFVPRARVSHRNQNHGGDEGAELSSEEANTFGFDGETIMLDELVRDEILLEIPIVPLCSEDCPGISPAPAVSDGSEGAGVDPRLLPLLNFRPKSTKS